MMKMPRYVLLVYCGAFYANAQIVDTPSLRSGDLPGLEITRTGHFDGKALYGYINGGAELYREYGFVDLTAQEMQIEGHQLVAELYRMHDSLAAFGIFSAFRGDCAGDDASRLYWCYTPGQVLTAAGRYFLRVQRLTGGSPGDGITKAVALRFLDLLPPSGRVVLPWFSSGPDVHVWERKAALVYGTLGLQNAFPDWADALEGDGYKSITIVPWDLEGSPATIGWILCASAESASALGRRIVSRRTPGWQYIRTCEKNAFMVIAADLPSERLERFAGTLLPH